MTVQCVACQVLTVQHSHHVQSERMDRKTVKYTETVPSAAAKVAANNQCGKMMPRRRSRGMLNGFLMLARLANMQYVMSQNSG